MSIPDFVKRFMVLATRLIYKDLLKADVLYDRAETDGLLTCITVDPPGLMDSKQKPLGMIWCSTA